MDDLLLAGLLIMGMILAWWLNAIIVYRKRIRECEQELGRIKAAAWSLDSAVMTVAALAKEHQPHEALAHAIRKAEAIRAALASLKVSA